MPDVVNGSGQAIRLGRELARGGEGIVFEVASDANLVAKIYHRPPSREKAEKLRIMAGLRTERVANLTAWPIDVLSKRSGEAAGLLMPKITGRTDIHNLYGPKSRSQQFLRADWRFLIRACANIARAFAVVHDTGCVIGDVNHGGVLVAQDATVRLIDCDSFQVISGGRSFLCEVGVENFTPPELQGVSFSGVVRTQNHDNFGLAVMIFLMLFMGRHPFDGIYLGAKNLSLGERIQQFRFAYSIRPGMTGMQRPPNTPPLPIVGKELGVMFERTFSREGAGGQRASARDWASALQEVEGELQQCRMNESHWHLRGLISCPWCAMEGATGVSLFPVIIQARPGDTFNIEALWRDVAAVVHPGPTPELAKPTAKPSGEAVAAGKAHRRKKVAAGLAAAAVAIGGLVLFPLPGVWVLVVIAAVVAFYVTQAALDKTSEVAKFRQMHDAASSRWQSAQSEWNARSGAQDFDTKRSELERIRREWAEIPNVRLRRLEALKNDQRRIQMERFLDGFEIDRETIAGIGPGRKQTLESYGVETAADIQKRKLDGIPGFGPKLQGKLLTWRKSVEARFVFDPRRAVDPRDIARVDQEVHRERQRVQGAMVKALAELKQIRARVTVARQQLRPHVEAAQKEYAQTLADYTASKE